MSGTELLDARLLTRLETLQLGTRRRLSGHFAGEHRVRGYGASVDFADYREYHPGDDFRRIDYHQLARFDALLIKLFEAEEDIQLRLLVDTSASMGVGGKLDQGVRIAAALGFISLVRRDPVTVHSFPLERAAPRFIGRHAAPALFDHLAGLVAGGETRFAHAAGQLLARDSIPGLTVLISDLLTPEWDEGVTRLPAAGSELVVMHVMADEDLSPVATGDVDLVDRETGEVVAVSLSTETLTGYRREVDGWLDRVRARCRQVGATYQRVMAGADIEQVLLGAWRANGVVR